MSNYKLSQQLNHINDNNYDDDISAVVKKGQFIAVTSNVLNAEGTQREMTVQIMDLEQAPGGDVHTNSGLYVRRENEASVKATLLDTSGKQVDENVTKYS